MLPALHTQIVPPAQQCRSSRLGGSQGRHRGLSRHHGPPRHHPHGCCRTPEKGINKTALYQSIEQSRQPRAQTLMGSVACCAPVLGPACKQHICCKSERFEGRHYAAATGWGQAIVCSWTANSNEKQINGRGALWLLAACLRQSAGRWWQQGTTSRTVEHAFHHGSCRLGRLLGSTSIGAWRGARCLYVPAE